MAKAVNKVKNRILVVDDEVDTHTFFKDFLTADGYEVSCALGWREAVSQLALVTPHLIILDIMMPEVNGYIIAETLKQEMNWQVPILVYSALNQPEDIMRGFTKGSNAFLCKPAPISELRETIAYLLNERTGPEPSLPGPAR